MNRVFLVSSSSITLILQRCLFSPGEAKDESGLEALEYRKKGPGDLLKYN